MEMILKRVSSLHLSINIIIMKIKMLVILDWCLDSLPANVFVYFSSFPFMVWLHCFVQNVCLLMLLALGSVLYFFSWGSDSICITLDGRAVGVWTKETYKWMKTFCLFLHFSACCVICCGNR